MTPKSLPHPFKTVCRPFSIHNIPVVKSTVYHKRRKYSISFSEKKSAIPHFLIGTINIQALNRTTFSRFTAWISTQKQDEQVTRKLYARVSLKFWDNNKSHASQLYFYIPCSYLYFRTNKLTWIFAQNLDLRENQQFYVLWQVRENSSARKFSNIF